jgi:hypothetical protein
MTASPRYEPPLSPDPTTGRHSADLPVTDAGSSTTDTAKARAGDVKDSAKDAAVGVAGTAREQASQVAGEAQAQARDLLSQGRSELADQTRAQQQRAASSLHALSRQLHEMSAGASEPGLAQDLTSQVAGHAASLASWLEDREPAAVLDDVRAYARRRPGMFLAACAGAGVLVGRLGRGLQSAGSADAASGGTDAGMTAQRNVAPTATPDLGPTGYEAPAAGAPAVRPDPVSQPAAPSLSAEPAALDADWAAQGGRP